RQRRPRSTLFPYTTLFRSKVSQPSLQSACAGGASAKQRSASVMRSKPRRKGDRFIDFVVCEVLVFIRFLFPRWLILRLQVRMRERLSEKAPSPGFRPRFSIDVAKNLARL